MEVITITPDVLASQGTRLSTAMYRPGSQDFAASASESLANTYRVL